MKKEEISSLASAQTQQVIKQVTNAWIAQNKIVTDFFNKYEDSYYLNEVAPGRNRAVYVLGHLIAINDGLFPMLGFGDRLFPQLEGIFLSSPDKTISDIPSIAALKEYWQTLNTTLTERFQKMKPEEWFERHTKVSEEDFAADPLRNKLNVLIGRAVHLSYHVGQLIFLTPRNK